MCLTTVVTSTILLIQSSVWRCQKGPLKTHGHVRIMVSIENEPKC